MVLPLRSGTPHDDAADPPSIGPIIVAIPACDEAERIGACLAALAMQRDHVGAPLDLAKFSVLVLANNCRDDTAAVARRLGDALPYRLDVVETELPPALAHAGGARRCVMELCADRLEAAGACDGHIFTTDADSRAAPTWLAAHLSAFALGADAVAGYIDADPEEFVRLGAGFGQRGRREDRYIAALNELQALCDPRPHDPWPNHRVASGASLAVTLGAYRAVGGLPAPPSGEDAALAHALDCAGFRIRHSLAACVFTSCRLEGRAVGGAADTMRLRFEDTQAPCDGDLEPACRVFRRALWQGRLRHLHEGGVLDASLDWAPRVGLDRDVARALVRTGRNRPFARLWDELRRHAALLAPGRPLRPAELEAATVQARRIIARLRWLNRVGAPQPRPADRPLRAAAGEAAAA